MKICTLEGCNKKHKAKGFCNNHYRRFKTNGTPLRPKDGFNCHADKCDRKGTKYLYCDKHYYRYKRYGDPLKVQKRYQKKDYTLHELFESSYLINKETGCWEWQKGKNSWGYGRLNHKSKHYAAHRYSFEYHKRKIPKGAYVCHTCDNPACVNPEHLFLGDAQTNIDDMVNKGRHVGRRKLNESQVKEIRKLLQTELTQSQIAKIYEVSRGAISNIAYGQTWRNVK